MRYVFHPSPPLKLRHFAFFCTISVCLFNAALAQDDEIGASRIEPPPSSENADGLDSVLDELIANQLKRQRLEYLMAPIKSQADLAAFLEANDIENTPFASLPPASRKDFFSNLVFTDKGLASFSTAIKGELSPLEAYEILSLFGAARFASALYDESAVVTSAVVTEEDALVKSIVQSEKDQFLEGYYCEDVGTCAKRQDKACTLNC